MATNTLLDLHSRVVESVLCWVKPVIPPKLGYLSVACHSPWREIWNRQHIQDLQSPKKKRGWYRGESNTRVCQTWKQPLKKIGEIPYITKGLETCLGARFSHGIQVPLGGPRGIQRRKASQNSPKASLKTRTACVWSMGMCIDINSYQ